MGAACSLYCDLAHAEGAFLCCRLSLRLGLLAKLHQLVDTLDKEEDDEGEQEEADYCGEEVAQIDRSDIQRGQNL